MQGTKLIKMKLFHILSFQTSFLSSQISINNNKSGVKLRPYLVNTLCNIADPVLVALSKESKKQCLFIN
jgi:hypothetical protein